MHVDKIKVLQEIARLSGHLPEISLHEEFVLNAFIMLSERMTPVYQGRLHRGSQDWLTLNDTEYANALNHPEVWETRILWTK